MPIIGSINTVVTLAAADRHVTLAGPIDAYGSIGVYTENSGSGRAPETIFAAVFGPSTTHFTIDNIGTVSSAGTTGSDAGIALGAAGTIVNTGGIYAGTGIALFGKSGASKITNSGEIKGYDGAGIYARNFASVSNSGGISGAQGGLLLAAGGFVNNMAGGLIGARDNFGIQASAAATIVNNGEIYGMDGFGGVRLNAGGTLDNNANITQFLQTTSYAAAAFYQGGTLTNSGSMYGGSGVKFQLPNTSTAAIYIDNLSRITAYSFTDVSAGLGAGFLSFGLGIDANAAGLAVNTGVISGNHVGILFENAPGTVNNTGFITAGLGYGVDLAAGGTLSNGGTIDGYFIGVDSGVTTSASTITNTGLIEASKPTGSAPIANRSDDAIIAGGPATVSNLGAIDSGNIGVYLQSTGQVRNTGQITAGLEGLYIKGLGGYGYNAGQISAQIGMALGQAGELDNQGTISVSLNGLFLYKAGTFINTGIIDATGTYIGAAGIVLQAGGEGVNAGQISGAFGLISNGFATVTNTSTGTIKGTGTGGLYAGVLCNIGGGYLRNSGAIIGAGAGIAAEGDGAVTVINTGLIGGPEDAIGIAIGGGGTVDNFGTISGSTYALSFATGYADRLIIDAASVIQGSVQGGNGILELAADGHTTGTVTPAMWTQFANFGSIQIDTGAIWDFSGNFTIAGPYPLLNDGTIKESGTGRLVIDSALAGTGTVNLSKKTLTLAGSVASRQKIAFTGTGETLDLGDPKAFRAKIDKFKAGDTIDLTGITLSAITATHFVHSVLTLDEGSAKLEFTFANPGTFGPETFKLSADGAGTAITLSQAAALLPVAPVTTLVPVATFSASSQPL